MTTFIFFGRLEYEKGIDLILDVFPRLYAQRATDWKLDIYGAGDYNKTCEALAALLPNNVFFHGRTDQAIIQQKLQTTDYCIMPSRVIETFGLSALEALRAGVPVIGFKKGGVAPFVIDELNITTASGETYEDKLFSLLSSIITKHISKNTFPIGPEQLHLAQYTPDAWLSHIKTLAGDAKRILMVSDFGHAIGGIETYIREAQNLLEKHGYTVDLFFSSKTLTKKGLLATLCNISSRRRLRKKIKTFQPDIVRSHSVIRHLGWLPLTAIPRKMNMWMMFHDMGYYVPYPSNLYNIHKVADHMGLLYWLRTGDTKNPLRIILLILKRLLLRTIRGIFRTHSTTYLVPSNFMKEPTEKRWAGKEQKVIVLPHFVK